jgi:hypothetical protein
MHRQQKKTVPKEQAASEADTVVLHDELQPAYTDTILVGDLNGDHISDTAFMYTPPTIASVDQQGVIHFSNDCVDSDCYNKVTFSVAMPVLKHKMSVWGALESAGDLDNDGFAELLFNSGWFTSSWTHLYLYSLKNGQWKKIAEVTNRRDGDEHMGSIRKQLIRRNGNYYLKGTRFIDGDDKPYTVKIPLRSPTPDTLSIEKTDTLTL